MLVNNNTAKNKVIKFIEVLAMTIPEIELHYKMDVDASAHFIKVIPESVLEYDEFTDLTVDFISDFYKEFPGDAIAFVSEDTLINFEKMDFSALGSVRIAVDSFELIFGGSSSDKGSNKEERILNPTPSLYFDYAIEVLQSDTYYVCYNLGSEGYKNMNTNETISFEISYAA